MKDCADFDTALRIINRVTGNTKLESIEEAIKNSLLKWAIIDMYPESLWTYADEPCALCRYYNCKACPLNGTLYGTRIHRDLFTCVSSIRSSTCVSGADGIANVSNQGRHYRSTNETEPLLKAIADWNNRMKKELLEAGYDVPEIDLSDVNLPYAYLS